MSTTLHSQRESTRVRRDAAHVAPPSAAGAEQSASIVSQLAWPALLVLLGLAAMSLDIPLARWIKRGNLPDEFKEVCDLAEVFGHGVGAAIILLAAWVLSPQRRPNLPRVIAGTYLPGLAANVMKMMLSRYRPYRANVHKTVLDTFQDWFPLLSAGSAGQSFPSGHTTTAVGLAVGLTWLFPRGRWLFFGCAVLAALQRIFSGYHFLSDTLWGAALGWLFATACLPGGWLSSGFDRLQQRLTHPTSD